jgi:hypothetical protein
MNLPESFDLDPDGDLTLILFDKGETDKDLVEHLERVISLSHEQNGSRAKRSPSGQTHIARQKESPPAVSERSSSEASDSDLPEIRLKVSSKHLTLASAVFKALLRGDFAESGVLDAKLPAEVRLPDDEPPALLLLLYTIHGQPKKVPEKFSLNTLTHIAVLIDKYELHEVTAAATDAWFNQLEQRGMTEYENCLEKLYQYLCISWAFRWPNMFDSTAYSAMLCSEGNIAVKEATGLPILASLLGECPQFYNSLCQRCVKNGLSVPARRP